MLNKSSVQSKLFYRGYSPDEAVDYAERIMANLNSYAKKQDDLARARKQRKEEERELRARIEEPRTACAEEPDKWFPELPSGRRGRYHKVIAERTIEALEACSVCPIAKPCGQMGMEEGNIYHGIWGGMLAYDRIEKAGLIGTAPQGFEFNTENMQKNLAEIVDNELILQGGDNYARLRLQMWDL